METTITNHYYYIQLMANGFYDKLFFVDKLYDKWRTLVDYGCGDGFNTKMLGKLFRNKYITGYDIDPRMLNTAAYNGEAFANVSFTDKAINILEHDVFFTSSTIHELYHYGNTEDAEEFWALAYSTSRKYVCIRDMTYRFQSLPVSQSIIDQVTEGAKSLHIEFELERFISRWGDLNQSRNLMHWLMKYCYFNSPNWEREINENYLPVSYEDIAIKVPKNWEIFYQDLYQLPYFTHIWKRDIGITLPYPTHVKMIMKRK